MNVCGWLHGVHRNSVVVLTALLALFAMHGLMSDHAMAMPTGAAHASTMADHSAAVNQPAAMAAMPDASDTAAGKRAAATSTIDAATFVGHGALGMCVGVLASALLLWLLARRLRHTGAIPTPAEGRPTRANPVRAGSTPWLCPSLVKLCILRT